MKKVWKSMDYSLLLPLVILCVLGVIMVYSSSSIVAISRFDKPANFFFKRQLITLVVGTIVLIIIATIPYKVWRKRIFLLGSYGASVALFSCSCLFH